MDSFPFGAIHVFDDEFRYFVAGGEGLAGVGLTRDSLEGKTIYEVFSRDVVAVITSSYRDALAGQASMMDIEYGGRIYSQCLGPVRDSEGEIVAGMGFTQDVTETRKLERELNEERRRSVNAQIVGRVGSWEWDLTAPALHWSDVMLELYGLDRVDFDADVTLALRCILPDDRSTVLSAIEACIYGGGTGHVRFRVNRANDGELRWLDARGEGVYKAGQLVRLSGAMIDVTDHVLAENKAEAARAWLDGVLKTAPDHTFILDIETDEVIYASRETDVLGLTSDAVLALGSTSIASLVHPDDQPRLRAANLAAADLDDGEVLNTRYRGRHVNGQWRWLSRRVAPFQRNASGRVLQIVGSIRDVTEVVEAEARANYAAVHDGLTGLPNRALLIDRLESALLRSEHDGREIAVLYCDLDGFKRVNDAAGHAGGDLVLIETAKRLQAVVRDGDTVARVGGDEFVIVVEPWNRPTRTGGGGRRLRSEEHPSTADGDRSLALQIADRVVKSLAKPITVDNTEYFVTVSIGVNFKALSPSGRDGGGSADQILQDADAAMYQAKGRGKDRVEVFEHGLRTDMAERSRVEQVLRQALRHAPEGAACVEEHETASGLPALTSAYQPIYSSRSGKLVSFEALARLTDANGLDISPDVFIAIAEDTGLIQQLGVVMLEKACRQLELWRARTPGIEHITMAVNISALQARDATLASDVYRAHSSHHLAASDLVLELTETAMLQAAHSTLTTLRQLRSAGVGIAIDDFGTGYASLRYLATLPVSALKVDRSFTAGLPSDTTSCKIVKAVASLAADLDLDCIIEGVETVEQQAALPVGVLVQGWLTGRPAEPDRLDLDNLLRSPRRGLAGRR